MIRSRTFINPLTKLIAVVGLIGPGTAFSFAQNVPQANTAEIASIDDVVRQVKQALADVQTTLANSGIPPLQQVKLTLQTTATKKGGATLKLWVITIGGSYEKDKAQQMDIVLAPPNPGAAHNVASAALYQELEDAIVSAAQGVKNAGTGPVPLKWSTFTVQLSFTVKGDLNGGAGITILPITADFSGDLSKTAVQTLTLTFANKPL